MSFSRPCPAIGIGENQINTTNVVPLNPLPDGEVQSAQIIPRAYTLTASLHSGLCAEAPVLTSGPVHRWEDCSLQFEAGAIFRST